MEPIPESREADRLYGPFLYQDADLLERLVALGDEVRCICPECFGLSLSLAEEDVTFTVVADRPGGQRAPRPAPVAPGPLGEESWAVFAATLSTAGVSSTLSLPVQDHGSVTGSFNLYGAGATTFEGRHAELARVLGASADGAVTNGDLDFTTRDLARHAPRLLRDSTRLASAAGLLAHDRGVSVDQARAALQAAAERAGVSLPLLVDTVIEVMKLRDAEPGGWNHPLGG